MSCLLAWGLMLCCVFGTVHAVSLDGHEPWIVDNNASPALTLALRDVAEDWYTTLGYAPLITNTTLPVPLPQSPTSTSRVIIVIGTLAYVSSQLDATALPVPRQKEGHACILLKYNNTCACQPLVCAGYDEMGAVYATYALSHHVLGVDPQSWWVNRLPQQVTEIDVAEGWSYQPGTPTWEYRGFFINDEDQLGGAFADPLGANVFSLSMWDRVYQTILRLKGNAVIIGTSAFPDETMYELATRRGLHIAQHHISLLGVNSFKWPNGLTYSHFRNPEVQEEMWRRTVRVAKNRKMLWTVGYRGLNDYPFWIDDPSFNTSQSRGALISQVLQRQVDIVHEETGDKNAQFFTFLWDEMAELYSGGYLTIPDGVTVVHADDGSGVIPTTNLTDAGHGTYYHVMMESGKQNQLTEYLSPHRFYSQLNEYVKKKATKYFMLNVSDLRAVALSLKCVMDYLWNPSTYVDVDPYVAETNYISQWVSYQYAGASSTTLNTLTQLYISYYSISYMDHMDQRYGEQYLNHAARALAYEAMLGVPNANAAQAAFNLVNPALPIISSNYEQAVKLVSSIPISRIEFYKHHILSQYLIQLTASETLMYAAVATVNMINATHEPKDISYLEQLVDEYNKQQRVLPAKIPTPFVADPTSAIAAVKSAISSLDLMYKAYRLSESTSERWSTWFAYDTLNDNWNLREVMNQWLAVLISDTSMTILPLARPWRFGTGNWSPEFQYEFIGANAHNFPTFYPTEYTMRTAVLLLCETPRPFCNNTPTGGIFVGSTTSLRLTILQPATPIVPSIVIRYTLDGSTPTSTSPSVINGGIIKVTGTSVVTAQIYDASTIAGILSRGYFASVLNHELISTA